MAIINPKRSASKAYLIPRQTENHPFTKPLQVQKIPPHYEHPEAPLAEPSIFTLIHPEGGKFHVTGMIEGPLDGLPLIPKL